jgi:ATP-dependent Clp protease ATP-binding subunit ClpC
MNYSLNLSEAAKRFVADKGYDPQFGARPLHRAIQKYLEDPLAEFILNDNPPEGSVLEAVLTDDGEGLRIEFAKTVNTDVQE